MSRSLCHRLHATLLLRRLLCFMRAALLTCVMHRCSRRMKLPKLSLEEILTGAFVIAVGGLMMSFSI